MLSESSLDLKCSRFEVICKGTAVLF